MSCLSQVVFNIIMILTWIFFLATSSFASSTEGLWVPRHESLVAKSWRVDFQNLVAFSKESTISPKEHQADMSLNYGLINSSVVSLEAGVEWHEPTTGQTTNALLLNAKISTNWYRERGWGISVGAYDVGFASGQNDNNILYIIFQNGLGSNWSSTIGAFAGSQNMLRNSAGRPDNQGIFIGLWRQMARDFSMGIEWQSTATQYGYFFGGLKWEIKQETHLSIGYGVPNTNDYKQWVLARISLLL